MSLLFRNPELPWRDTCSTVIATWIIWRAQEWNTRLVIMHLDNYGGRSCLLRSLFNHSCMRWPIKRCKSSNSWVCHGLRSVYISLDDMESLKNVFFSFYVYRFNFWSKLWTYCASVDRRWCTHMRLPSTWRRATTLWYLRTTRATLRWLPSCSQSTWRETSPKTLLPTSRSLCRIKQSRSDQLGR